MKQILSTGSPFEKKAGYSRTVVLGDFAHVAGTTGYDYTTITMPEAVSDQTRNTIATISNALEDCGFSLADVVRATHYVTSREYVEDVFAAVGEAFADIRPAATMVICDLVDPAMKVEITVTAQKDPA